MGTSPLFDFLHSCAKAVLRKVYHQGWYVFSSAIQPLKAGVYARVPLIMVFKKQVFACCYQRKLLLNSCGRQYKTLRHGREFWMLLAVGFSPVAINLSLQMVHPLHGG